MRVHELHYSNTNTYLIEGDRGRLLFDTGWAGTFPAFCRAMGETGIAVADIDYILISHYHPDHMGIAQEIADLGAVLLVPDVQADCLHAADSVFEKEKNRAFIPVRDDAVLRFSIDEGADILARIGLSGRIIHTPGHSYDSISLYLDTGELFVGDLNPLYELELHAGTQIGQSWDRLLALKPKTVYYGHAKTAQLGETSVEPPTNSDLYALVSGIIKLIDRGCDSAKIRKKTGADDEFIQDVMRMYLTHQNVGVQGILDRIEIKNK
ncbi:MAG: MBL fold metallo-hydrolase [Lachnospiraceae bacterium]|nr:MBL fold metallo-hydrolase [Lachnospiraceae bacterium]